ncbi:MAG: OmpA family protein [Blastocatellia bacterium]
MLAIQRGKAAGDFRATGRRCGLLISAMLLVRILVLPPAYLNCLTLKDFRNAQWHSQSSQEETNMNTGEIMKWRLFTMVCGMALLLAVSPLAFGQVPSAQTTRPRIPNTQPVPNGAKLKFKGVVINRAADTFTIRDRNRTDYQVLLTDSTSIKTYGGFFRRGKKYAVTDILRGLIVEVDGRGDAQGQLVADNVRFNESDMRAAITTDTRVNPVEENQERLSGQMDELSTIAAEARNEVRAANERISALDDYDVQESATVTFRVNSAVLSPEAKRQLDTLAEKALTAKWYMIEVGGHTDSTGSEARNFLLSRQRAEAVIQYLAVRHKIPVRRFVSPMGYGKTDSVADNKTTAGRAQNRRVEVKVLLNRGMSQRPSTTSTTKQ